MVSKYCNDTVESWNSFYSTGTLSYEKIGIFHCWFHVEGVSKGNAVVHSSEPDKTDHVVPMYLSGKSRQHLAAPS